MLFSRGNTKIPTFTHNGKVLDNVNTYRYLGIILHKNGKFAKTITITARTKANRVTRMLKQILGYSINAPVKLAMSLFDKQLATILLYGSAICNNGVSLTIINIIYIKSNVIDSKVKKTNSIRRLNRTVIIDETRPHRD